MTPITVHSYLGSIMIEGRFTTDGFTVHRNGSGSTMLHHQALHTPVLSEPHPSPPQNNSARTPYRIEYFRQPLDHFNLLTSNQTFQQRYACVKTPTSLPVVQFLHSPAERAVMCPGITIAMQLRFVSHGG